ncbi:hypothetical protein M0R45_005877 [Rubus argutus]|uniref:Transposase DDE domain-containing protein n=1 Tax=Rubus argutus TaxID=59490 RepID=A0AAW1YP55_RUBAR
MNNMFPQSKEEIKTIEVGRQCRSRFKSRTDVARWCTAEARQERVGSTVWGRAEHGLGLKSMAVMGLSEIDQRWMGVLSIYNVRRWLAAVGFQEIWNGFVDRAVIAGIEECRITLST